MLPDTLSPREKMQFEATLSSLTVLRQQEVTPTEETQEVPRETTRQEERTREQVVEEEGETSTSTKISKGLLTGNTLTQGCGNTMPYLSDLVPFHSGQVENFYLLVLGEVQMY